MAANIKKIQSANTSLTAALQRIEIAEKERERLRKQRDQLNEDITILTQQITTVKVDLDLAIEELRKAAAE